MHSTLKYNVYYAYYRQTTHCSYYVHIYVYKIVIVLYYTLLPFWLLLYISKKMTTLVINVGMMYICNCIGAFAGLAIHK